MKEFKWNSVPSFHEMAWKEEAFETTLLACLSDKKIILHPDGKRTDLVIRALCRVVAELVEIEEKKK